MVRELPSQNQPPTEPIPHAESSSVLAPDSLVPIAPSESSSPAVGTVEPLFSSPPFLLETGGIFTYFLSNNPSQIPKLLRLGFSKVICFETTGFEVPPDCTYAESEMDSWLNVLAIK